MIPAAPLLIPPAPLLIPAAPLRQRVSQDQLIATAACLLLALLPHLLSLQRWLIAMILAAGGLRVLLALRGRDAPPRMVSGAIALLAIVLLFTRFRSFSGLAAGTALLTLTAALKLLETRTRRDLCVIALIGYFLCLTALLADASFWLLGYTLLVAWVTSACLLRSTTAPGELNARDSLRDTGRLLLQAAPIALVLWLFFPRFAEPLWHLQQADTAATTGLSDTLSPGDITDLALSDEVVMRAHFRGAAPPARERYWRGPVLFDFDGRTWRRHDPDLIAAPTLEPRGPAYVYTLNLEPHGHNWIYALDWPSSWNLPGAYLTADYMLAQPNPVARPLEVTVTSHTQTDSPSGLGSALRARDTRLPAGSNPRTRALAARLRAQHADDGDYVAAVLEMFQTEQYFYTLEPPPLGADSVDEFLFETKRGFCGHYASAFAVLMRAAGIPARVVTGYYGGTYNRYADDWLVRQSDAHAWVEVWIDGRGWRRVDPTSAIAPDRVDHSVREAESASAALGMPLPIRLPWLRDLRLRTDALRELWRARILQYNQDAQQRLLERFNVPEPDVRKLVMLLAAALSLALAWLTWQVRRELKVGRVDAASRAFARLCAKLAACGLRRGASEPAESFALRVAGARPDLAAEVAALCRRYNELRYGAGAGEADLGRFTAAVRAFRPRAARGAFTPRGSRASS
jgi:transglutaminase-like putative cysteine protease